MFSVSVGVMVRARDLRSLPWQIVSDSCSTRPGLSGVVWCAVVWCGVDGCVGV